MQPLAGDAGFRRYYRLNTQPRLLAVDSPPAKERNEDYVSVSMVLNALGVKRPKIHAVNYSLGFLLLEDLGTRLLQSDLDSNTVSMRYDQAEAILYTMQSADTTQLRVACYDEDSLTGEFDLFATWFVNNLLGYKVEQTERDMLRRLCSALVMNAVQPPQVLVHRDFHSRNLMILENEELGVIDFQDAVIGPVTYDLVSLLKDAYIEWDEEIILDHAVRYWEKANTNKLITNLEFSTFYKDFECMGIQRHLKILGIFARLSIRDNKNQYLENIPLVEKYLMDATERYRDFHQLRNFLDKVIK